MSTSTKYLERLVAEGSRHQAESAQEASTLGFVARMRQVKATVLHRRSAEPFHERINGFCHLRRGVVRRWGSMS